MNEAFPCDFCGKPSTNDLELRGSYYAWCDAPSCKSEMTDLTLVSPAYCPPEWAEGKTYTLDADQAKKFSEWTETLPDANVGAIGGRYTFSFCGTGLGIVTKVTDAITKQECDLTDYDSW